jgi:thiol-disulfide isomerase/thioredoxin
VSRIEQPYKEEEGESDKNRNNNQQLWHIIVEKPQSDEHFDDMIRDSREAILCFFAEDCNDSTKMAVVIEALGERHPGAAFIKVDVHKRRNIAQRFNILRTPTFVALYDGREAEKFEGADEQRLSEMIERRMKFAEEHPIKHFPHHHKDEVTERPSSSQQRRPLSARTANVQQNYPIHGQQPCQKHYPVSSQQRHPRSMFLHHSQVEQHRPTSRLQQLSSAGSSHNHYLQAMSNLPSSSSSSKAQQQAPAVQRGYTTEYRADMV